MALSPLSAPASPLSRQLLRYVSSGLAVALDRRAPPTISLPPSAPRGAIESLDMAASASQHQQRLQIASRAAPSPRGRPGAPRQGSGGKTNTVGAMALAATARVVMRGPTGPGAPAQGSGGKVHAVSPAAAAMASVLMRGPAPPGPPAQGTGGRGGSIHAVAS